MPDLCVPHLRQAEMEHDMSVTQAVAIIVAINALAFFAGNVLGWYRSGRPFPWNWRALINAGMYFRWVVRNGHQL